MITKLIKCSLSPIQGNFSVNRKYLQAFIIVGPTRKKLAVQHLNKQLYNSEDKKVFLLYFERVIINSIVNHNQIVSYNILSIDSRMQYGLVGPQRVYWLNYWHILIGKNEKEVINNLEQDAKSILKFMATHNSIKNGIHDTI